MTTEEVLDIFRAAGALLEGHFILSSGRRSPVFLQKAMVFSQPDKSVALCKALAPKLKETFGQIDVVVGPAMGGVIPSYELARHLGCRAIYAERPDGEFVLKRGFEIKAGERALIVEDIVTTGLSFRETVTALQSQAGEIVGGACFIDRSGGKADVGCELVALASIELADYAADDLPPELAAIPAIKPGSRTMA